MRMLTLPYLFLQFFTTNKLSLKFWNILSLHVRFYFVMSALDIGKTITERRI